MVGPSKILTVSYGTFSCTLEGFDDSFDTMKAIAEYFRDLAADDRYFGAEPPTPDAEMLTRIAEREVSRRVEARMDASGITLRTGAALSNAADAGDAISDDDVEDDVNAVAADETAETDVAPAMPPAAKAVPMAPLAAPAPSAVLDDTLDQDTGVAVTADAAGIAAGRGTGDWSADLAPTLAAPAPAAPVFDEPAPILADTDSIAAKLQRIRAVVGQNRADFDAVEDDNTAVDPLDDDSDNQALHDALGATDLNGDDDSTDADMAADDVAEDDQDDSTSTDDSETLAAMMTRMDQADDDTVSADAEPAVTRARAEPAVILSAPADVQSVRARVIRMKKSDFERAVAKGQLEAETDDDDESAGDDFANLPEIPDLATLDGLDDLDIFGSVDADMGLSAEEEAELLQELAEVRRESDEAEAEADAEADEGEDDLDDVATDDTDDVATKDLDVVATDDLDDVATDDAEVVATKEVATDDAAKVSDDERDDAAEVDFDDADDGENDDHDTASQHDPRPGRAILSAQPEADEAAMSRILSQTDAELLEPEGSRRRQAIAQLKAAVAATEAARRMGEAAPVDDATENAFRDDLDQAVRPRRAIPDGQRRPDAERPRPAPLKLVASQRIDVPGAVAAPASGTPVRPRRVQVETIDNAPATTDTGSFADYAESVGATTLQDLLEAAAAYTAFVEGMEDFSRPEIMKKVRQLSPEDFSREDGLRSFGTLLRQGRIAKIRNGRFQISDQTRFRPEAMAARG